MPYIKRLSALLAQKMHETFKLKKKLVLKILKMLNFFNFYPIWLANELDLHVLILKECTYRENVKI